MIVLDTNVVSAMMRSPVDAQLQQWATQVQESFLVTSVSIVEIQYGIERLPVGRRRTYLESSLRRCAIPQAGSRFASWMNRQR
jgi:predicted nucleic acid-binding protein